MLLNWPKSYRRCIRHHAAQVYKALKNRAVPVAVKVFVPESAPQLEGRDVDFVKRFQHDNVLRLLDVAHESKGRAATLVITEYVENRDLWHALHGTLNGGNELLWYKRCVFPPVRVGGGLWGVQLRHGVLFARRGGMANTTVFGRSCCCRPFCDAILPMAPMQYGHAARKCACPQVLQLGTDPVTDGALRAAGSHVLGTS